MNNNYKRDIIFIIMGLVGLMIEILIKYFGEDKAVDSADKVRRYGTYVLMFSGFIGIILLINDLLK